jgi:hypothetical protein
MELDTVIHELCLFGEETHVLLAIWAIVVSLSWRCLVCDIPLEDYYLIQNSVPPLAFRKLQLLPLFSQNSDCFYCWKQVHLKFSPKHLYFLTYFSLTLIYTPPKWTLLTMSKANHDFLPAKMKQTLLEPLLLDLSSTSDKLSTSILKCHKTSCSLLHLWTFCSVIVDSSSSTQFFSNISVS